MDSAELGTFRKSIERAISSENGEGPYEDFILTFMKNTLIDFPNVNFLKEFLPIQFPLLVIHKPFNKNPVKNLRVEDQSILQHSFSPKSKPKKPQSYNSDLEGSPLKLQSYADVTDFDVFECTTPKFDIAFDPEDLKFGIKLATVRKVASLFNCLMKKGNVGHNVSLLCFCDGNDRKKTACIYTHKLYSEKKEYLGLKSIGVHVKDPIPNNEHLPNLQKLDFSRKQVLCGATYDILNDTKEESQLDIKDQYRYKGSLLLDVTWTRHQSSLDFLHPPPPEALTTIKAVVIPGSLKSAAHNLFQELSILKNLIEGLKTTQVTWIPEEERSINIMKSVRELFETLKIGDAFLKNKEKSLGEGDNISDNTKFVLEERSNFDFTDHLWKILSNCTSYQELVDALKFVFTALGNGELQPLVHRGNDTMVAQLVRDSFSGKLRIPNLAGLYPVELLVEIGIQKLKQDYLFAFLSKDLATREILQPFVKVAGEFMEQLKQLEKLHSVIEMIAMFQFFLKIPVTTLSTVAREVMQHYEKNKVSDKHVFKFIIPTSSVLKDLEGCPPSTWQLDLSKMIDNVKETESYLLTSEPPFKHLNVNDSNMNTKEDITVNETKVEDSELSVKLKKTYFLVKKSECISVMV